MSVEERERQRFERLRNAQIAARDPGPSKIRHYDWSYKKPAKKPRPLVVELLDVLPSRLRGALAGFLFGLAVALILMLLIPPDSEWRVILLIPLLICSLVGYALGKTLQD